MTPLSWARLICTPLVAWAFASAGLAASEAEQGWLDQLVRAVGDKRIVQLGESGHGVSEFYTVKTDIVRQLHEQGGFDVLAVEGGVAECWIADRQLADASPQRSMRDCFWDTWAGEESVALFAYLRSRRDTERPLRLVGFDNQPTSEAFQQWLDSGPDELDADLAATLAKAESAFARLVSGGANGPEEVRELHGVAVDGFKTAVNLAGMPGLVVESRLATLDFDPETLSRETLVEMRDRLMADLLARQIREDPDARIMVWAHNAHVSHAYSRFVGGIRRQGEIIHDQMGDQVYTIGIYSGTGRAYAWFMNEDYRLEEPAEDSLEGRLLAREGDVVFADLAEERARGNEWVSQPIMSFEWGMQPQMIVPDQMYDGVLVVREVSPLTRNAGVSDRDR